MMTIRRKKLGTTYTKCPADMTKAWFVVNLGKIIFSFFISIAYLFLLYGGIGIVGFIGRDVACVWDDNDFVTADVYSGPLGLILKVIGLVFIFLYVFRDAHQVKK
jgi:hypothetical protein